MIQQPEYLSRRQTAAAAIAQHEIDALFVTALPNIRYLTGFTGSNALLVLTPATATLFTDPRYTIQAATETSATVKIASKPLSTEAARHAARKRWRRIGVEEGRLSYSAFLEFQSTLPTSTAILALPGIVEALRTIKSGAEIELIRRSVQTNSNAFAKALKLLKPGWTENRLAAEIDYQMRRHGAEGNAFESIVAAGPRSALPHARPTAEALGSNRLLLIDIGSVQDGYSSDMTRVLHLGKPGAKAKQLYKAVLEAQLAAIDAVREGVTGESVDRAARRVLKKCGLEQYFIHSTGHGLGLEIHESPRIGRRDKTLLQAGMAITIEPGAYIEDFGGVRIEDTVVVTSRGCEILTPTSKELLAI